MKILAENPWQLNIEQVRRFLPHRQPFLLVDRILGIEAKGDLGDISPNSDKIGVRVSALKNVTYNEPYFMGHFPSFSILPGVLIVESMAQAASFSIYPYLARDLDRMARDFQCILVGVDSARFRKPVVPGDTLMIDTVVTRCRKQLWSFDVEARVNGQLVAEARLLANLLVKTEPELAKSEDK